MKEVPGERSKQFIDKAGPSTHEAKGLHSGVSAPGAHWAPWRSWSRPLMPSALPGRAVLTLTGPQSTMPALTHPHRYLGVEIKLSTLLLFSLPSRVKSMGVSALNYHDHPQIHHMKWEARSIWKRKVNRDRTEDSTLQMKPSREEDKNKTKQGKSGSKGQITS